MVRDGYRGVDRVLSGADPGLFSGRGSGHKSAQGGAFLRIKERKHKNRGTNLLRVEVLTPCTLPLDLSLTLLFSDLGRGGAV